MDKRWYLCLLAASCLVLTVCLATIDTEPTTALPVTCDAPQPEPEPVRYELTDEERTVVEQVVMAESGAEPYCGQMLVAQCILNAAEREDLRPDEVIEAYRYTSARVEPSESVVKAVSAVFDRGEVAVDDTPLYFYAPALVSSEFHEGQRFIIEVNGHRFFGEASS